MEILRQRISDHKTLVANGQPVQREIIVYGVNIDGRYHQIPIDAEVQYTCHEGKTIEGLPNQKLTDWNITDRDTTTVRDEKGNPVKNPQFVALAEGEEDTRTEEQKEEFLKVPSFTYFAEIITNPNAPNLVKLLQSHIILNDKIGFFG